MNKTTQIMRNLFAAILVLATVVVAGAQGVSVGLKGGLNFPSLNAVGLDQGVSASNVENSTGYHVGPFIKVKVSRIAVQGEVLYSFQETNFNANIGGNNFDVTQRLGYLTVPIMARLYTVAGINLQVGPQFGFLLNGTQEDNILGAQTSTDLKNSLKASDIGINVGAGIDLPFGLDLHARYVIGISDINDVAGSAKSANSQFQVSIGYAFLKLGR
jgi:hypothetical protein